jgi:hypothetical protein
MGPPAVPAACPLRARRAVAPPSSRITRSRPRHHRASCPVPHDGQASRPPARPADTAAAPTHNSMASLPDHDATMPGGTRPPGGARAAVCLARRRPATQTAEFAGKRHRDHQQGIPVPPRPALRRRMLTVSSRTKTDTTASPDRHAHAERHQPPSNMHRKNRAQHPGSVRGWLRAGTGALEPRADLRGIREAQTGQNAQSRLPGGPGGGRVPGRVLHVAEPD